MEICRKNDLAWTKMDKGLVVLDLGPVRYVHHLNETAAFLWNKIDKPTSLDALVSNVLGEYDIESGEATSEVNQFYETMTKYNLIDTTNN